MLTGNIAQRAQGADAAECRTLAPHTIKEFLLSSWAPKQSTFTASRMSVQRLLGEPKSVPAAARGCNLLP